MTKRKESIQQLKDRNELILKWLSLLVHDFKGSFSNILWWIDAYEQKLITQEVFFQLLPEIKRHVEMHQQGMNDTFEWIKRQMTAFSPQIAIISISEILDDIELVLQRELQKKDLVIVRDRASEQPIKSDRVMMQFILKRLIDNAIKYSYIHNQILVSCHGAAAFFSITIKDQGRGMSPEVIDTLFTLNGAPFTGTLNERGNGLSLILVKDFVEMLGGQINIRSNVNTGTEIELTWIQSDDNRHYS